MINSTVLQIFHLHCKYLHCIANMSTVLQICPLYCKYLHCIADIAIVLQIYQLYCKYLHCFANISTVLQVSPMYCKYLHCMSNISTELLISPLYWEYLHCIIKYPSCYDLALLPLIICLGSIAWKCIFNFWQLRKGIDPWLSDLSAFGFLSGETSFESHDRRDIFISVLYPLLRFLCKMGAGMRLDRKWLCVIINDDFLEKGKCYDLALLPSIICLGRLRIACSYVDSLAQWLEHGTFIREHQVRFPR